MNDMETPKTKVCRKCGEEKPVDQFRRMLNSPDGYTHVCRRCIGNKTKNSRWINRELPKGANPELARFAARELIEELKSRGYTGELQCVHTVKL